MLILEEYFRRHLEAFASELFILFFIQKFGVVKIFEWSLRSSPMLHLFDQNLSTAVQNNIYLL